MPEWFDVVWPVAAFFLGGASAHMRDALTEKRTLRRETTARKVERDKAVLERKESFELDHLQKLNDALNTLGRTAARAHHTDSMSGRSTGIYAGTLLTDQTSDDFLLANRTARTLIGLVLNDELRDLVERTYVALNLPSTMIQAPLDQAEAAFAQAIELLNVAQAAIARRIRDIYVAMDA